MESLDGCEISDVECDVEEAQEFFVFFGGSAKQIFFELNVFCQSSFPHCRKMN